MERRSRQGRVRPPLVGSLRTTSRGGGGGARFTGAARETFLGPPPLPRPPPAPAGFDEPPEGLRGLGGCTDFMGLGVGRRACEQPFLREIGARKVERVRVERRAPRSAIRAASAPASVSCRALRAHHVLPRRERRYAPPHHAPPAQHTTPLRLQNFRSDNSSPPSPLSQSLLAARKPTHPAFLPLAPPHEPKP